MVGGRFFAPEDSCDTGLASSGIHSHGLEQFSQFRPLLIGQRGPGVHDFTDVLAGPFAFELAAQLGYVSVGVFAFYVCDL